MGKFPQIVITGIGIEIPGLANTSRPLEALTSKIGPDTNFYPEQKLGKRGLRYKDRATQMAMCAAQTALQEAKLPITKSEQLSPERFGIVASSNLSNLDSVCKVVETIRNEGVNSTSSMDLPNASSNIVATSIAIRFGLKALNLMVCNGATSGIDALYLAANTIRAGRASRMLVVGVETTNIQVMKLMRGSMNLIDDVPELRIREGAAAVVLESSDSVEERQAQIHGSLGEYSYHTAESVNSFITSIFQQRLMPPDLWVTPNCAHTTVAKLVAATLNSLSTKHPTSTLDLGMTLGETYGALGVFQCIAACLWLQDRQAQRAIITSGGCWGDGISSLAIYRKDNNFNTLESSV
jgi:3-oxoacyl-[acyl-carrier-protein] synthase II